MKKLWKILLAIGGVIAGLFMLKSNISKKEFTKKTEENDKKLEDITKKTTKVENEKAVTKSKIKETSTKIKALKTKIKNTKNAKSVVNDFKKKYKSKK
jgi:peptidoglycan hydrolase CwlO-like protein